MSRITRNRYRKYRQSFYPILISNSLKTKEKSKLELKSREKKKMFLGLSKQVYSNIFVKLYAVTVLYRLVLCAGTTISEHLPKDTPLSPPCNHNNTADKSNNRNLVKNMHHLPRPYRAIVSNVPLLHELIIGRHVRLLTLKRDCGSIVGFIPLYILAKTISIFFQVNLR